MVRITSSSPFLRRGIKNGRYVTPSLFLNLDRFTKISKQKTPIQQSLHSISSTTRSSNQQNTKLGLLKLCLLHGGSLSPSLSMNTKNTNTTAMKFTTDTSHTQKHCYKVFIAVGSNMGDRFKNIMEALEQLKGSHQNVTIMNTSHLHETAPMYNTNQSSFLNGVIEVTTNLSPPALLRHLKSIEANIGRDLEHGIRYGPRPVDLDILLYNKMDKEEDITKILKDSPDNDDAKTAKWTDMGLVLNSPTLMIPHPRMQEREFVLLPMCDIDDSICHPVFNQTMSEMMNQLLTSLSLKEGDPPNSDNGIEAIQVLPLPRGRMLQYTEVIVMGILNVTPDSFSDGGKYKNSVEVATKEALQMVTDGAGIIDIGGESTRPGAKEVRIEEELNRTIPIIRSIRKVSDVPISIDTRHAKVAKEAILAGADIVNDVSGGTFDPEMLPTVAALKVPIILMHMRGTPETMQSMTNYDDVVMDVSSSLLERSNAAKASGIARWLQVLDPGIGFAKDLEGNLSIMKHMKKIRETVNYVPILLGPSRKGFIGKITGELNPEERDFGTVAACVTALAKEINDDDTGKGLHGRYSIVRVHNVKGVKQAMMIMESILDSK